MVIYLKNIMKLLLGLVAVFILVFLVYVMDYNKANSDLDTYISESEIGIYDEDGIIVVDGDKNNENALIFYPGGKVEYIAYLPLLEEIAGYGYDCYMVNFPFNLAVLDSDKADLVLEKYDAENWYLMGHSLGGAMGSAYIVERTEFSGLILLGSYPASDLSESDLDILQLNGSLDSVLNREKAAEAAVYLNDGAVVYEIEGGNHSGFGDYGLQDKDTVASITAEKQREITALMIYEMVGS